MRPAGETTPKRTSPTPRHCTDGCPACRMALMLSSVSSGLMSSGTADIMTTTTGLGLAAAATVLASCSCAAERERFVASCPSWAVVRSVPSTSTVASLALAAAVALAMPLVSSLATPGTPFTNVVFGTYCCTASTMVLNLAPHGLPAP